jgi:predicted DNA-binding transcriptional regulator YafY
MPANKYALLRYRIIDRCLTNPARPFPSKEALRLACEEALYGSDGEHISISTIEKDLWAMRNESELGYHAPIAYHRDERGYHYTEEGYSISDIQLNDDDLDAIRFATNTLLQFRELPIFQQFDQALGKIADRLTVAPNLDTAGMDYHIQFESTPHAAGSEHLAPLLTAIRERTVLRFSYRKFSDPNASATPHVLHPYLLKEYRNRWYLIGWDPEKAQTRTYGCDRMAALEPSAERFVRNPEFNAATHFAHALGITVLDTEPVDVSFRCDDVLAKYLSTQPLHPSQTLTEGPEGTHVTLHVLPTFELQQWLLAHARELTLLGPLSLKTTLEAHLSEALTRQQQG